MTFRPSFFTPNTVSSVVVQRPITSKNDNKKNEIFVDIFEKISVLLTNCLTYLKLIIFRSYSMLVDM